MVLDLQKDRQGGNPKPLHTYVKINLKKIIKTRKVCDIWRELHPDKLRYTWENSYYNVKSRLDRIYIPDLWADLVHKSDILPFSWSDHDMISVKLSLPVPVVRGSGYWKFNTNLLNDQEFTKEILNFWEFWLTQINTFDNITGWWDGAKSHFKRIAIIHSVKNSKIIKRDRADLVSQLEHEREANPILITTDLTT